MDAGLKAGGLFTAPSGAYAARVLTLEDGATLRVGGERAAHTFYVQKGCVELRYEHRRGAVRMPRGSHFLVEPGRRAALSCVDAPLAVLNHYALATTAFAAPDDDASQ
jgi:phage baseplate assembly protein gpV